MPEDDSNSSDHDNDDVDDLLLYAAEYQDATIVNELLEQGANVNAKDTTSQRTALHWACWEEKLEVARLLVDNGADVNVKDVYGETPFDLAASQYNVDLLQLLVDHGCEYDVNAKFHNGMTRLHGACQQTDDSIHSLELVQWLIDHGAQINTKNIHGSTPLSSACYYFHLGAIRLLIEHGADLNSTRKDESTCLYTTCSRDDEGEEKNLEVAKILVESGRAGLNNIKDHKTGKTCLHIACEKARFEITKLLLANGAKSAARDKRGMTPLHLACERSPHLEIVQLLLLDATTTASTPPGNDEEDDANPDLIVVNSQDNSGKTPLYLVCEIPEIVFGNYDAEKRSRRRRVDTAKCLVEHAGADLNKTAQNGKTALHEACENGHLAIVQLLLSRGANVNIRAKKQGKTPLDLACEQNQMEVVWLLVRQNPGLVSE